MPKKILILITVILLSRLSIFAAGLSVTQQGPGSYTVGQTFRIEIRLENAGSGTRLPSGFAVPGCAVISQSSGFYSSVVSGVGGRAEMKETQTVSLIVSATTPGKYSFSTAAGSLRSNTITYQISGSASSSPAPSSSLAPPMNYTVPDGMDRNDVMILATVSNRNPYTQQGILYTVKLFTRISLTQFPDLNYPKFENCTYEILPDRGTHELTRETLNGVPYMSVELYSMIVYPSKPGKALLKGGENIVHIDYFTDIPVKTNDIEIDVKELPDLNAHSDINGVGEYSVKAQLLTEQLRTGEPAKVRFIVSGKGNPSFVSLPDISTLLPEGFKLIKTDSEIEKTPTPTGIDATITFDCTLLPSKTGDFVLPAIKFAFFNPNTSKWYTPMCNEIPLNVIAGATQDSEDETLIFKKDLQTLPSKGDSSSFYISSIFYWLIYLVLALTLVVVISIYRKRLALYADANALKHKKAGSVARTRLKTAYKAMKSGNTQLFYDEILKAFLGYLGDKLMMPTSEFTRPILSDRMSQAGVSADTASDVIEFIDVSEFAKYASAADTDMESVYGRAVDLIGKLEEEIDKASKQIAHQDETQQDN